MASLALVSVGIRFGLHSVKDHRESVGFAYVFHFNRFSDSSGKLFSCNYVYNRCEISRYSYLFSEEISLVMSS